MNKHLIIFQNCFVVVTRLRQGTGKQMSSRFRSLRGKLLVCELGMSGNYLFQDRDQWRRVLAKELKVFWVLQEPGSIEQLNLWSRFAGLCLGTTEKKRIHAPVKGKAVPLQTWSDPEGSRKLRLPDFMTTAQDGGKVVNLTHRPPLTPENTPGTHFC